MKIDSITNTQLKETKQRILRNVSICLTHATCSFSISRNSDSSSHGESASIQILLPTVGRSDGKNGIIDIFSRNLRLLNWTTEVMSFSSFVLSKKNIQVLTGHAFVKKSSTLRISMCWIWKVFKVLNTFSMHCVPTSSHILFKLGFWTLRWKRAEILHI